MRHRTVRSARVSNLIALAIFRMSTRFRSFCSYRIAVPLWLGLAMLVGCEDASPIQASEPPNILWIVWDTTRADHMSLYGHDRDTTPFLDDWAAQKARVFENCISTASSTVPSHASMFTGKLPTEHGAREGHQWLDDHHETLAELLGSAGYRTFLWAANPHLSRGENFDQGFDSENHPWDKDSVQEAYKIVLEKIKGDESSELPDKLAQGQGSAWLIKAAGELAEKSLQEWLGQSQTEQPFFAFINYMEAHRPFIPPAEFRRRMMSEEDVKLSYKVDRSWTPMWSYTFGLNEYTEEELGTMSATYDATIAELDHLLEELLTSLEASGHLDNTVIVITGDHGEHLGEHHMLDHQYSLYSGLIHVPLIVSYPARFEVGRDARPVANFDIFPTLLELADVAPPKNLESAAVSLLNPKSERERLSELPGVFTEAFGPVRRAHPEFDPTPWNRRLRAFHKGDHKFIWSENGQHELYNLANDPQETTNLYESESELAAAMFEGLQKLTQTLKVATDGQGQSHEKDAEYLEMLQGLGYIGDDEE